MSIYIYINNILHSGRISRSIAIRDRISGSIIVDTNTYTYIYMLVGNSGRNSYLAHNMQRKGLTYMYVYMCIYI